MSDFCSKPGLCHRVFALDKKLHSTLFVYPHPLPPKMSTNILFFTRSFFSSVLTPRKSSLSYYLAKDSSSSFCRLKYERDLVVNLKHEEEKLTEVLEREEKDIKRLMQVITMIDRYVLLGVMGTEMVLDSRSEDWGFIRSESWLFKRSLPSLCCCVVPLDRIYAPHCLSPPRCINGYQ